MKFGREVRPMGRLNQSERNVGEAVYENAYRKPSQYAAAVGTEAASEPQAQRFRRECDKQQDRHKQRQEDVLNAAFEQKRHACLVMSEAGGKGGKEDRHDSVGKYPKLGYHLVGHGIVRHRGYG